MVIPVLDEEVEVPFQFEMVLLNKETLVAKFILEVSVIPVKVLPPVLPVIVLPEMEFTPVKYEMVIPVNEPVPRVMFEKILFVNVLVEVPLAVKPSVLDIPVNEEDPARTMFEKLLFKYVVADPVNEEDAVEKPVTDPEAAVLLKVPTIWFPSKS